LIRGSKLMRRASAWFLTLMLLLVFAIPAHAESGVRVLMNGSIANFDTAIRDNGRVYLPLTSAADLLGLKAAWSEADQKITLSREGTDITLWVDAPKARVNGKDVAAAPPARLRNGQVYVPLRFVAQAADTVVGWNPQEHMITLTPVQALVAELMTKSQQQTDQRVTGTLNLKYAITGAPGMTIDIGTQLQLDSQIYKGDSLTKVIVDMDGDTTTIEEAVVGGKTYTRDEATGQWSAGLPDSLPDTTATTSLFGDFNPADIGQVLTKTAKASVLGTAELDEQIVRVKLDFATADLEQMLQGLLAAFAPAADANSPAPTFQIDHFTSTFWVNTATMVVNRSELDMDATFSVKDAKDPMTLHITVKGAFNATALTEPIQFPADLPR
jgi:hypothetical protein